MSLSPENFNSKVLENYIFSMLAEGRASSLEEIEETLPPWVGSKIKEIRAIYKSTSKRVFGSSVEAEYAEYVDGMNQKFALVLKGGTAYVTYKDEEGRRRFVRPKEMAAIFESDRVAVGTKSDGTPNLKNGLTAWMQHPNVKKYMNAEFLPYRADKGNNAPSDTLNLFGGYSVSPEQIKAAHGRITDEFPVIDYHIKYVIAKGDANVANYIYNWCAYALQNPEVPQGSALVFVGGKRIGKSLFAKFLASLFGEHGLFTSSPDHLIGRFTSHLETTSVLVLDEGYNPRDKRQESAMKSILTEDVMAVEGKFEQVKPARNSLKVIITSNDEHVVAASGAETRFAVIGVSDKKRGNKKYFQNLADEMTHPDAQAGFIKFCLKRNIEDFSPQDIPMTAELMNQKTRSIDIAQSFLLDLIERGGLKMIGGDYHWQEKATGSELYEEFIKWCDDLNIDRYHRLSHKGLGVELQKYLPRARVQGKSLYTIKADDIIAKIAKTLAVSAEYLKKAMESGEVKEEEMYELPEAPEPAHKRVRQNSGSQPAKTPKMLE